jgi:transcriptional repressor NrdR
MKCPFCFKNDTLVRDSRNTEDGKIVRRRRCCNSCGRRFTTFERIQLRELVVVKRSGIKKPFDRDKIYRSINTAVRKRNVPDEVINDITNKIVLELEDGSNAREVHTKKIGELILEELAKVDQVAYIRFASVYKDFTSSQDFAKFIGKIKTSRLCRGGESLQDPAMTVAIQKR